MVAGKNSPILDESPEYHSDRWGLFSTVGFAIYLVLVSGAMLTINSALCISAHAALLVFGPEWLTQNTNIASPVARMFFYVVPVLLMVLEWKVLDFFWQVSHRDA